MLPKDYRALWQSRRGLYTNRKNCLHQSQYVPSGGMRERGGNLSFSCVFSTCRKAGTWYAFGRTRAEMTVGRRKLHVSSPSQLRFALVGAEPDPAARLGINLPLFRRAASGAKARGSPRASLHSLPGNSGTTAPLCHFIRSPLRSRALSQCSSVILYAQKSA